MSDLRRIAESADDGGRPWTERVATREGSGGYPQQILRMGDVVLVAECYEGPDAPAVFAEHITTFDPPTVLKMLDTIDALNEACGAAMAAVESLVNGNGPRGAALLPLIAMADRAANARDELLANELAKEG